jgi:predicted lipase
LQPSGSERARQIVKITAAAAGIREQHNRSARTVEGAFERDATSYRFEEVVMRNRAETPLAPARRRGGGAKKKRRINPMHQLSPPEK